MTPQQWERVFRAGEQATIGNPNAAPVMALKNALAAMAQECGKIAREQS